VVFGHRENALGEFRRVLDAAVSIHHVPNCLYLIGRPVVAASMQVIANYLSIGRPSVCAQVNERQRPLALVQIAEYLLAVDNFIPNGD
jgi:hypothetical protein